MFTMQQNKESSCFHIDSLFTMQFKAVVTHVILQAEVYIWEEECYTSVLQRGFEKQLYSMSAIYFHAYRK